MFFSNLATTLKIRPNEARLVLLVAGLFAIIELGRGIGGSAADALFFLRFGVDNLPYLYIALGVTNFVVTLSYAAFLERFSKKRFFSTLILAFAVILLAEWIALHLDVRALYPVLWLSVNIISALLGTLAWTTAGEVCDARQAKRLFPLFVSAGILGALLGSVITGPAAAALGTENLLVIFAVLLLIGLLFIRIIASRFFHPAAKVTQVNFLVDVRAGFDVVRSSSMLQLLAISAVLFSVLYFSVSFPFGRAVSASFSNEAQLAGFLGAFSGIASAITFVAALLIANRLYSRIGVVNSLLILPLTYLGGFVLFAVNFSLPSAVIVRLSQLVVLSGIGDGAYGTFFNVVPPNKRAQVRAFDSGVPSQIGIVLSGVLLLLGERLLTNTQIFGLGMIVALACTYTIWLMRRSYADALIAALRAGRVEVFAGSDFANLRQEASAVRIAVDALRDPKPTLRRLAAEMLTRMGASSAGPALIQALGDPDAEVRSAAANAIGELKIPDAARPLLTLLTDTDLTVRAEAAVALAQLGSPDTALPSLTPLLQHADPVMRALAISSIAEVLAILPTSSPSPNSERGPRLSTSDGGEVAIILATLSDLSPIVRRAACLASIHTTAAIDQLIYRVSDPDESVRFAAASALQYFGSRAAPSVLAVLHSNQSVAYDAALAALSPEDTQTQAALRDFARQEIARLRGWRDLTLPGEGTAARFFRDVVASYAVQSEQRLVKIISLLTHTSALDSVAKALKERDPDTRASAVEALDTLGDKQLTREVLPLLENAAPTVAHDAAATLATLLHHEDRWLRALAALAAGESDMKLLIPELRTLAADSDPLLCDAANLALRQLGEPMETLHTLSLMERIMLLREVPLFANLSPDDLKQIADVARENWYPDGTVVIRDGDDGHEMYIIVAGKMRVTRIVDGASKLLAIREVGETIGEMAIIESTVRFGTVQAEGEARTLIIDENAFKAILRDRPEVSLALLRALSRRLREKS